MENFIYGFCHDYICILEIIAAIFHFMFVLYWFLNLMAEHQNRDMLLDSRDI